MHNIKYSNQANIDLEESISHIARESISNALSYLSGYEERIELLRINPYMGVDCKIKKINRDCRVLVYKSHIVIYKVNEDKNEIFIIRVFHASKDYTNEFNIGER